MGITVGFDLDMTLIDPRPGMVAAMNALGAESGFPLDGEHFAANLGPPLDHVLRGFGVPDDRLDGLIDRFRETYPRIVIPKTIALPGANEALAAVRSAGGRVVVVTGKFGPNAKLHLEALGMEVDVVIGELWSAGKAQALVEHGASVYVGDHTGDIVGALAANAVPVGVTTGPCSRAVLEEAGAGVVLDSLLEFPTWLAEFSPAAGAPEPARRDRDRGRAG